MTDFEIFAQRKQQLQDHYERLIALIAERGVVPEPEADLALLRGARDALAGALLFRVLCVGDFSTGKSSFINRFLLEEDLLPAWATPTTTLPTRIRFGAQTRAIRFRPSAQEGADLEAEEVTENIAETLKSWVSTAAKDKVTDGALPVIVESPVPRLAAGVEIVDAPGLNDPNPERMKLTLDYLHQADGVLFFVNALQSWTDYQKRFFEGEILTRDLLKRLFIIVNYWDAVPAAERDGVLERFREQVQTSLARNGVIAPTQPIPILPVSAKTGENAALIQQEVWDVLGTRKSTDVLALRIARFNQEVAKYLGILEHRLALLGLNAQGQSRRRAQLQQEIKDYEQQREVVLSDLQRLLALEFQAYRQDLRGLFQWIQKEVEGLDQSSGGPADFKTLLPLRMSRLQQQAGRRLSDINEKFARQVRATIETQKATIGVPLTKAVTIEDYMLHWHGLGVDPLALAAPVAGGIGIGGLLVGAGTFWQTSMLASSVTVSPAVTGVVSQIGTWLMGAPAATTVASAPAATSSFLMFGVPGIAIGVLAIGGALLVKHLAKHKAVTAVSAWCVKCANDVMVEEQRLVDEIKKTQPRQIERICANVDNDINRELAKRLSELDAIQDIEDQGAALRALRDALQRLTLRVNP